MAECNQSLDSDKESRSDSSSDSTPSKPPKKLKHCGGLLTLSPKQYDWLNPYNQAWASHHQFQQATMSS